MLGQIAELERDVLRPLERRLLVERAPFEALDLEGARAEARARGLWTPQLHADLGGPGLTLVELAMVGEALGRSPLGHYVVNFQAPDAGNMELLAQFGTPEQRERFLRPLVEGRARSCFTMTEPENPGSNPVMMSSTARLEAGEWRLDGHKWFATAADGAAFAVAMMVTDPDAAPHRRASMILVPTDTPGFELVRNLPVMGETGSGWMSHAEVRYADCAVPVDHLLGGRGEGFALAQARLGPGRIHHCMRWIGICERAFDLMCRRVAERWIAPGVRLASRQIVQGWIADSRTSIDAARLMVLDAAERIDHGGPRAARLAVSTIKLFVAQVLMDVLDRALQAHGGLGMLDEALIAFWYRHERAARIYDGADEVHRGLIARQVLQGYGVDIGGAG
ncbi:MAG TPA: acyl-CoA dehydrogenase family protein [Myxococcota bacterium]|nr:acyl-CoA dehydrogenase family protein [Myxococcota bacterium]